MAARRLTPFLIVAVAGAFGRTAAAQTEPRLVAALQVAQAGMPDSARAMVQRLLTATEASDSLYPEILYTGGLVAATEHDRRILLRRVIVEYSTSAWADDALLLLGQLEYATGNPAAAVAQFARLIADYPTSPLIASAGFWGSRAAGDVQNGAEACRLAEIGLASSTDDVELRNQLEYQRQRCTALLAMTRDTARAAPPTPAPTSKPDQPAPEPASPAKGIWVQAIAAPTQAAADQTVAQLKQAGFDAAIVREGGFFKVRAGPFPTRAATNTALARIRSRLGGQPFVVVVDR
jgi:hypothetical protein